MSSIVQWHEGMLISPHHFQQAVNFSQDNFSRVSSSVFPFGYGLFELTIDTAALASGLVRVLKASGIFKDGLFFDYDATRDRPLEINLSDYFAIHATGVKVYLAIPKRRCGENMLEGDLARYYSSEVTDVKDENTGKDAITIPILKPNLRLLTEEQIDGRYQSFPVFETDKSVEGGIVATNFIGPFVALAEDSKILSMCREIVRIIREKISYFADRKDNMSRNSAEESLSNLRLLIQAALPLESMIRVKKLHPFELFKTLLQTAADIMAINPTQLIPRLPVYNHEDIYASFHNLCEHLDKMIRNLKQKYDVIAFEKTGNEFKLEMHPSWLSKDEFAIGVLKPFSATDNDIMNWIKGMQISSESMLPMIRDHRILGAERRILERGEYITQPSGMTIIAVKSRTAYILPNEKLCLTSNVTNVIPEEIVLYAERE